MIMIDFYYFVPDWFFPAGCACVDWSGCGSSHCHLSQDLLIWKQEENQIPCYFTRPQHKVSTQTGR